MKPSIGQNILNNFIKQFYLPVKSCAQSIEGVDNWSKLERTFNWSMFCTERDHLKVNWWRKYQYAKGWDQSCESFIDPRYSSRWRWQDIERGKRTKEMDCGWK